MLVKRDRGSTVTRERTPTLADFAATYIERLYAGERKRLGTIIAERKAGVRVVRIRTK